MYLKDLKVIGEREQMFQKQLQICKLVSDDIRKATGPVKCENICTQKCKIISH